MLPIVSINPVTQVGPGLVGQGKVQVPCGQSKWTSRSSRDIDTPLLPILYPLHFLETNFISRQGTEVREPITGHGE